MTLGTCPQCNQPTLEYENVYKGGSGYVDTLFCPGCQFFVNGREKGYKQVHAKAFPTPPGYNDRMVSLNDRADARLFAGAQKIGLMQNV